MMIKGMNFTSIWLWNDDHRDLFYFDLESNADQRDLLYFDLEYDDDQRDLLYFDLALEC